MVQLHEDILRQRTAENVLTSSEVAELLGITKQMVSVRYREGKLPALRETSNGLLFYRPDIVANSPYSTSPKDTFSLFCGVTSKTITFIRDALSQLGPPIRIDLFFNEIDAIEEGFYGLSPISEGDNLFRIWPASISISDEVGAHILSDGCNCGYLGTGPSGSQSILEEIGVPDELLRNISGEERLKYFFEDKWQVRAFEPRFSTRRGYGITRNQIIHLNIYKRNDALILIQDDRRQLDYDPIKTLEQYSLFMPDPQFVSLLTREDAISRGLYRTNYSGNRIDVYQLIVEDSSGNQLWFQQYYDGRFDVNQENQFGELLKHCGMYLPAESLSSQLKDWLDTNLFGRSIRKSIVVAKNQ